MTVACCDLAILGPPGSLKSEYCKRLVKRYDGFVHISMGELLREHSAEFVKEEQWQTAGDLMNSGDPAPMVLMGKSP